MRRSYGSRRGARRQREEVNRGHERSEGRQEASAGRRKNASSVSATYIMRRMEDDAREELASVNRRREEEREVVANGTRDREARALGK